MKGSDPEIYDEKEKLELDFVARQKKSGLQEEKWD